MALSPRLCLSSTTWRALKRVSKEAVSAGWATTGIFAPAVGQLYQPDDASSLYYAGQSGGPWIDKVGLQESQNQCARAAISWMLGKCNPSLFWRFADQLVQTREHLAWSNVAKIDTRTGKAPRGRQWGQIAEVCCIALEEELKVLRPARAVFCTGNYVRTDILRILQAAEYKRVSFIPGGVMLRDPDGRIAAILPHPRGWVRVERDAAVLAINKAVKKAHAGQHQPN